MRFRHLLVISILGAAAGCATDPSPAPTPDEIRIVPAGPLAQGDSVHLHAIGILGAADTITGLSVTWEALDPSRVTVTAGGTAKAVGRALPARVRATLGALADTLTLTITTVPASIQVPAGSLYLGTGRSIQLEALVIDLAGDTIRAPVLSYSPNDGALSVTSEGRVTAVGAVGPHGITVHAGNAQGVIQVVLMSPGHPTGSAIASHSLSLLGWGAAVSAQNTALVTSPAASAPEVLRLSAGNGWTPIAGPAVAPGGVPAAVAFSPTGLWAYVPGYPGNKLAIIHFTANTIVASIDLPVGPYNDVAASADGRTVYVATDAAVQRVDVVTRTLGASIPLGTRPNQMALAHGDSILYVSSTNGAKVLELDLVGDSVRRILPIGGNPVGVAVSPDASELYVADEAGGLLVTWNLATNQLVQADTVGAGAWDVELTPDGQEIWVTFPGTQHGTVKAYARSDRSFLRSMLVEASPRRIAFNPDGTVAIVANDGSMVNVIQ